MAAVQARPLTPAARIYAMSAFPALIAGTLAAAWWIQGLGVDPALSILGPLLFAYGFLAISERVLPWHRSWLHSQGDLRTDVGLFFTNGILNRALEPFVLAGTAWLAAGFAARLGTGLWPGSWPGVAQLALALLVAELVEYSFHRMMHEVPWLWRFHATHHSAPRLYWLNAARFHPIDLFLVGILKLVPLVLLGAPAAVLALVNLFSAVHGSFQHANVPVRIGPLNWIFSMTELHRWHHSPVVSEANHNYGGNLILWDVVFGTRFLPSDREPPEAIGIESLPDFPMGFWANLASPFRWRRLSEEAAGKAEPQGPTSAVAG